MPIYKKKVYVKEEGISCVYAEVYRDGELLFKELVIGSFLDIFKGTIATLESELAKGNKLCDKYIKTLEGGEII